MRMENIIIWAQANYNWLWVPLANELKKRLGAKIWKGQDKEEAIDTLISTNHFFFEYDHCPERPEDIYAQARVYEREYETLVVDILQSDRHLGRGFFSGGIGHPKSILSEKADYPKSVNIFNKAVRFWEDYFRERRPDLIVGVTSGIIGKTCAVVARKRGIPIRALTPAKYQSYFYWGEDEYYSFPQLEEVFHSIQNYKDLVDQNEISNLKRLPWTEENYQKYIKYHSLITLAKKIMEQIKAHAYRRYKGIRGMGNYKFLENIRYIYNVHNQIRNIDKWKLTDYKKLSGLSYVFYPLHVEPETALGMLSPEFNEQLALIELLAKNLPAGTFLVVKEHLATMGRRPKDFYTTIQDIPNVIMIHPYTYALEVAKGSRSVVVITSTLGTEAAILGIPVISFGIHNSFNLLPHVYVVESWKELRPLLAKLCAEDSSEAKQKRIEDGMRYLAALKTSSIDLGWSNYSSEKREPATEREVEVLYSSLMKSLDLAESFVIASSEGAKQSRK